MGQSTIPALEAAKVIVHHVDQAEKVPETVAAAANWLLMRTGRWR